MTKESLSGVANSRLVFRETFNNEQATRDNGGIPTDVSYSNGVGTFNGSSSTIGYSKYLPRTSYTIRCKLKTGSSVSSNLSFLSGNLNETEFYIIVSNSKFTHYDGTAIAQSNTVAQVNTEYEVVYAYDGTNMLIYVNGVYETTTAQDAPGIELLNIGSFGDSGNFWNGDVDLVEIYEGTLTANEVKNLYEGKAYKKISPANEILRVDGRLGSIENKYAGDIFGSETYDSGEAADPVSDTDSVASWQVNSGTLTSTGTDGSVIPQSGNYMAKWVGSANVDNIVTPSVMNLITGKTYRMWIDIYVASLNTLDNFKVLKRGGGDLTILDNETLTVGIWQTKTVEFIQGTTTTVGEFLFQVNSGGVLTGTMYYDNIRCKEVAPAIVNTSTTIKRDGDIFAMDFDGGV